MMTTVELLLRAFDSLEAELHHPEQDSGCPHCVLMWDIEQHVGRRLTDNRGPDVVTITPSVRPKT